MAPSKTLSPVSLALAAALASTGLACSGPNYNVGYGGGILGLIILIAWIVAIVQIIQSGMDSTKKLIWILVVILLPLIGTILWFIIGRK